MICDKLQCKIFLGFFSYTTHMCTAHNGRYAMPIWYDYAYACNTCYIWYVDMREADTGCLCSLVVRMFYPVKGHGFKSHQRHFLYFSGQVYYFFNYLENFPTWNTQFKSTEFCWKVLTNGILHIQWHLVSYWILCLNIARFDICCFCFMFFTPSESYSLSV